MTRPPPLPPSLGAGAEFDLIRRLLDASAPDPPRVALGAGDDCALIEAGEDYLAISIDLAVEGVHFRADWGTPELIGQRAVRAAASDLAAMAAVPIGVLVALSVPDDRDPGFTVRVGAGCREAAEALELGIIGGDLARGGSELRLDVVAVGSVREPLLRGGARAGDELWVTGRLGAAAAAVEAWRAGREPAPEAQARFWRPEPRLSEARWLVERGASAGIDLSDGLVADAGHIAAASGVGIEIDAGDVPAVSGIDLPLALSGGEDYELLVAVRQGIFEEAVVEQFEEMFGIPLSRVGRVVVGHGVRVFGDGGEEIELETRGYDHFA